MKYVPIPVVMDIIEMALAVLPSAEHQIPVLADIAEPFHELPGHVIMAMFVLVEPKQPIVPFLVEQDSIEMVRAV
jgi:hypothetical protein